MRMRHPRSIVVSAPIENTSCRSDVDDGTMRYTANGTSDTAVGLRDVFNAERTVLSPVLAADRRHFVDGAAHAEAVGTANGLRVRLGDGEPLKVQPAHAKRSLRK